jgi:signal transduction histidine kinase
VNNLLTVVLGNLALLRRHLEAPADPAGRYLDAAEQAARRGTGLTRRLLDLGRGPAGGAVAVDVAALVAGMEDLLGTALGPGIRVERRVPAGLPPVRVDAGQLELALLNLLLNARDAMPAGGTILLSAARHLPAAEGPAALAAAPHVVLTVADSGQGMDPATLAQATEPFFTTKPAGRGSGLGLSMVQGLAAQAGGQLVLRSAPGQGTEAALWLPAIAGAAMTARPAAAAGGAA